MRFPGCQFAVRFVFRLMPALITVVALTAQNAGELVQKGEDNGIAVEFSAAPLGPTMLEGDDVRLRFQLTDRQNGAPLGAAFPSGWIRRVDAKPKSCNDVVGSLLNADTNSRADVDLNSYYVLALNGDASITVVDPLFGYGGTKLLALVTLPAPGEDWALAPGGAKLFVTVPDAGELTVIDTSTWKVEAHIPLPARPRRVAVQPDGGYVWVTLDSADTAQSAVAVFSAAGYRPVAQLAAGPGEHAIAFSADSRWTAVTSSQGGSLSLIDVAAAKKAGDFRVGAEPVSVAYSPEAKMFYAADRTTGDVVVVDPAAARIIATVPGEPGVTQIRFDPRGRLAFIVNPEKDRLRILDSASNRIVQSADMPHGPDQVNFSGGIAYVRFRRTETIQMIPLDAVGVGGKLVPTGEFQGGQHPFGEVGKPSPADGLMRAPGENAMLVANPADKAIYYFKEGLPAPMGSFSNYGRQPRAVLVVDRSLKQRASGVFETIARLPSAGDYYVALLVDSPRVVQCFPLTVARNPAIAITGPRVRAEFHIPSDGNRPGQPLRVTVRMTSPDGSHPAALGDVRVLAIFESGSWFAREPARPTGDGTYAADVVPPGAGRYRFAVESPSQGLTFNLSPQAFVEVSQPVRGK